MLRVRRRGLITIDVVAAEAGVSASTVSHVLNGRADKARISTATRERVASAARRLGYAPNHAARSLRRQRSGSVTVLLWRLSSPLFAEIATGVRNVAERRGYQVGVIDAGAVDEQVEARALRYLRTGISDGVVVATSTHRNREAATEALLELVAHGIPATLVLDQSPHPSVPAIDIDGRGGAYLATTHLTSLGHRRIAHFTFGDTPLTPDDPRAQATRYHGYLDALAEAGIEPDPDWLFLGRREVEGGRQMAHALVARFPERADRPTAIVAFNDRTAVGVLRGCYEAGIRVPEDVAVVGFHGIASGRYTTPALTTIEHPRVELGEMAAESLFTLLEGGEVKVRDQIVPVSLTVRESCGARLCSPLDAPVPSWLTRGVPVASVSATALGSGAIVSVGGRHA